LTRQGIRALEKQHVDHAAECFRKAVDADYRFGPAHNNLGLMHYEQGNLYQAAVAFQQARRWMPNDPAVLYNLALTLESAGRTDEALTFYYQANELDPVNPNYLGNLVRLRLRMGERDELLRQQLRDLVLIETRPQWRRWADRQLALTVNDALDRGPPTPDFSDPVRTAAVDAAEDANRLRDKIIDLTPVVPVSAETTDPLQQHFEQLPDAPAKRDESADPDQSGNSDRQGVDPLELAPPRVRADNAANSNEPASVLVEGDASLEDYFRQPQ
jgi:tetratricopeptide (TPR) repeat protein